MGEKKLAHRVQNRKLPNPQTESVLVIAADNSATEEAFQAMQHLNVAFMLNDDEFRQDLVASGHVRMTIEADMKTTFTVNESDHPI